LFDKRFQDILHAYPLAEQVAPDIRIAVESGQIALEKYLLEELRDSPHDHLRRCYQAVPLYLQHLFYEVSRAYTKHPDNYDRLITEALRLDRVTFVTLNYDTLLDERLSIDQGIASLNEYVDPRRRWSLMKLHGSIHWGERVQGVMLEDPTYLSTFGVHTGPGRPSQATTPRSEKTSNSTPTSSCERAISKTCALHGD
jgi:hypothetical protein